MKQAIICFCLLSLPICQIKASDGFYYTFIDSIVYRVNHDLVSKGEIIPYNFPPIEKDDAYSLENLTAVKLGQSINQDDEYYGCTFKLTDNYLIDASHWYLLKVYSKNIDTLYITAKDAQQKKYILSKTRLSKDRNFFFFKNELCNSLIEDTLLLSKQNLSEISIEYKNYKEREQKFIISDFQIYVPVKVISRTEKGMEKAFINKYHIIARNKNFNGIAQNLVKKDIAYFEGSNKIFFLKYPLFRQHGLKSEEINNAQNINTRESLKRVNSSVREILVDYINNTESIDVRTLLDEFDALAVASKDLDDYYGRLQDFLPKLNENHFRLINRKNANLSEIILPIYFYDIKNDITVCGVFDTLLVNKVNLGDKLLAINNMPIDEYLSNLVYDITGSTMHVCRAKAIQKLLTFSYQDFNKELTLTLKSIEGKNYSIKLTEDEIVSNQHIKLPSNIQKSTKRFNYKSIDNIAYLKVGRFEENELRAFLYSVMDSVMNSKGLVIDIRNNPGGDLSAAFLYSFFVNKPEIYFTYSNVDNNRETVVVNPDPFYNYTKPIIILFDTRTTCSAEFFLSAMMYTRDNIKTVSSSISAGSAQNVKYLELPVTENYNARLMYRNNTFLNANNENIDLLGGIMPDIWVSLDSYLDLAPYHDKLLKQAIEWLSFDNASDSDKSKSRDDFWTILLLSVCINLLLCFIIIKGLRLKQR